MIKKRLGDAVEISTDFAGKCDFVSRLIFIVAIGTTKVFLFDLRGGFVKTLFASNANYIGAGFWATSFSVCMITFCRAKLHGFRTAFGNRFTTAYAGVCSYSVFHKTNIRKKLPTQKPVALYKWLLKNYAKPGDTILDTHGGSMSIVLACIDMGFDIDIWEKDPDYYFAAKKRIENHVQQLPIFGEPPIINFIH